MMGNNNTTEYKVLWVTECDVSTVNGSKKEALTNHQLELIDFSNWDDAEADLNKNFKDYSAIILGPQCKLHSDRNKNNVSDLMVVVSQLREIFALRYDAIAWYILGTGAEWSTEKERGTVKEIWDRMSLNDDWGEKMAFEVNSPDDENALFAQIKNAAEKRYLNSVLYKHKDTLSCFSCLESNSEIDFTSVKENLIKTLAALYDPQNFKLEYAKEYKDYANILRQILECMFTAAYDKGILPSECFHKRDRERPNLKGILDYMAGFSVRVGKDGEAGYIRRDIKKGGILSPDDAKCLDDILKYFNEASHYGDNAENKNDRVKVDKKELFFGYTMKLCHIIRQLGDYIGKNPCPVSNGWDKSDINKCEKDADKVINLKEVVKYDEETDIYHVGPCELDPNKVLKSILGQTFIIEGAEKNPNTDYKHCEYPLVATRIRPSIFLQDNYRETVHGRFKFYEIKHHFYAGSCKLDASLEKTVRDKKKEGVKELIIVETEENFDDEYKSYPYIAKKIEFDQQSI